MSIGSTEKCTPCALYHNLPNLTSINALSSFIEAPPLTFNPNLLSLFEFIAYNASLRDSSLSSRIDNLKSFIQFKDAKPNVIYYLHAFNKGIYLKIIRNYFTSFANEISQERFFNNTVNAKLLVDLLQLIPYFYTFNTQCKSNKSLFVDESITFFLISLNENSRKYEKNLLKVYDYYIKLLTIDYLKKSSMHPILFRPPCAGLNELQEKPHVVINNYSSTIINNELPHSSNSSKMQGKSLKPAVKSFLSSSLKLTVSVPQLIDICNSQYASHLKKAKFHSCVYYQDDKYILSKVGSFTLGLNMNDSSMDLLIEPTYKLNRHSFSMTEMINWMRKKTIFNTSFSFDCECSNSYCKRILQFSSIEANTNLISLQVLKKKTVRVYLYNERFQLINQLFKSFFGKGNVFSKLYVFFYDILSLESGFQLCLLIHAFYITHYKLTKKERRFYSYKCMVRKGSDAYSFKSKAYFYFEANSIDFIKAVNDNVDTLIPAFLGFFIQTVLKVHPSNQHDLIKQKNYLFSVDRVIEYVFKDKKQDYCDKIIQLYQILIEKGTHCNPQ